VGLRPDGFPARDLDALATPAPARFRRLPRRNDEWTAREATRTRAFWLVTAGTSLVFVVGGAINLHQMAHLQDQGLSSGVSVAVVAVWAVASGFGGLIGGWLEERLAVRYAMAVTFLWAALSVVLLIAADSPAIAFTYAVVYGLSFGANVTMMLVIYADYFGRGALGAIMGLATPFQLLANSTGPVFGGWVFDETGSYRLSFWIFVGFYAAAALCVALARPPYKPGIAAASSL
jgi:MFS family permease